MAKRSGRGVTNIATAPFDLVNSIADVQFKEGWMPAMTYGVFKGIGIATARVFYGLYEVGTFYDPARNRTNFDPNYDNAFFRT